MAIAEVANRGALETCGEAKQACDSKLRSLKDNKMYCAVDRLHWKGNKKQVGVEKRT